LDGVRKKELSSVKDGLQIDLEKSKDKSQHNLKGKKK
jgi:hypothetical protein